MSRFFFVIFSFSFIINSQAAPLEYFLPKGELYNSSIPTPEAVLGQQLGDRHLRHDQIIYYLSILASANPRAKLIEYGKTSEGRRLVLLAISSSANINNLDTIKNQPEVLKIWNGFSIHGNESSGSNAAVLYAWYLLASSDEKIKQMLNDTVVLIDPSFNPDGLDRFTTYVNNNRSLTTVTDSNDFSHNEPWPGGRTNHYWFDLNRDWLLLTQTESRSRLAQFHQWQPHVLTDHHEMGSEKSYFFQPGVPERTNPLIPAKNIELTRQLAKFHAKALDEVRQTYYSEESFDDFYPGKGSTYPDLQGSIGILFEQSSARGGILETDEGMRKLEIGIRNQFLTALSSLKGSYAIKDDLINYKKDFFVKAKEQAAKDNIKGYLLDIDGQRHKGEKLIKFLQQHQIDAYNLAQNKTIKSHKYKKNAAVFIPSRQKQYTLIKSLFSRETSFKDNTFYDVSAWNLAMAWGFHFDAVSTLPETSSKWPSAKPANRYKKQAIAYVFDWQSGNSPAALNYLLNQQYVIKTSAKPLHLDTHKLSAGSFILEVSKDNNTDKLFADLSAITELFQVAWYPVTTGLTNTGIDLGSPNIQTIQTPKVLMLIGNGVNPYQAGSIWHLFDTQVYMPLTRTKISSISKINFSSYSHIILPSGNYNNKLNDKIIELLNRWVKNGGTLIGLQKGAQWIEEKIQKPDESKKDKTKEDQKDSEKTTKYRAYADYDTDNAKKILGGAIVSANADLSHPLAFGMNQQKQYVLMRGTTVLTASDNPYASPLKVSDEVRAAGYVSDHWQEKLSQAPLLIAERSGKGLIIKFGFNPNFRAFWLGTQKWLINAIYQSHLIKKTDIPD